jgi:peptide/nickel transport system substrate-binding protein
MDEQALRQLISDVEHKRLSRRDFIDTMVGLGLSAPLATQMLTYSGIASAQPKSDYKPTKRGGGGALKLLWWQGATLLNPHFATGTKDQEGSRIFYEPLAAWDPTATWCRCWPPKSPAPRTAACRPTARPSPGS